MNPDNQQNFGQLQANQPASDLPPVPNNQLSTPPQPSNPLAQEPPANPQQFAPPPQAPQAPPQAAQQTQPQAGYVQNPGQQYQPAQGQPGQFQPGQPPQQGVPNQPQQAPLASSKPPTNPNSTQNVLQIAEIRDGVVIMNDGSFRSVIMVKSINFDLMSPQEREAVEFSYQGFLNSLYFPVQIFIRSQRVDMRPYIEKLDKIRTEHENMLLSVLMDDYIGYIDNLSAQTNIMDKHFYVVIPYIPNEQIDKPLQASKGLLDGVFSLFSNTKTHVVINEQKLEEAKTELKNRVQAALAGLQQANIQGLPLDTQELIELYYDSYNPDTATRQQLKNFNDMTAPVITKGEGQAPQPGLERELG